MNPVPDRADFETAYAGPAPWEINKPQPAFVKVADQIQGHVLDSGCGSGENALFFASRGHKVTGTDFLEEPIKRAKRKAAERGLAVDFLVADALTLPDSSERFDTIIDSGVFHVFSDENRKQYVEGLATVLRPGGRLFLICFSEEEPGTHGPRRITRQELIDAFSEGWSVVSIEPSRYEVRNDHPRWSFSPGGAKAWFAVLERKGMAPPIETVVETAIYGDDLKALEAFYVEVIGLPVIGKEEGRHVFFRVGAGSVLLIFRPETTLQGGTLPSHGTRGPGHFAMGIQAEVLDAWRQHLVEKGIAIEKEMVWPQGGKSLYFRDPAGNSVELVTPGLWGTPSGW